MIQHIKGIWGMLARWMFGQMDEWVDGWVFGQTGEWVGGQVGGWIDRWADGYQFSGSVQFWQANLNLQEDRGIFTLASRSVPLPQVGPYFPMILHS